ncbi:putative VV D11-like helicase [Namao virus]|nr:putative VV D11-like helicase [Namao virus]
MDLDYNFKKDLSEEELVAEINRDYSYPEIEDHENFQYKMYKKREYYIHKIEKREALTDYDDIKKFRDSVCGGSFQLRSSQSLLTNIINPNTPFKGLLVFHGVGTGKCVGPSTLVWTMSSNVQIDKIPIKDLWDHKTGLITDIWMFKQWKTLVDPVIVVSHDPVTQKFIFVPCRRIYRQCLLPGTPVVHIVTNDGTVLMTMMHRILNQDQEWIYGHNAKVGDKLLKSDGSYSTVTKIKRAPIEYFSVDRMVYDLEIPPTKRYVIGCGWISHNTCAAVTIAEHFKNQVKKYGTKIHILVPGPLLKEHWKDDIIKCTKVNYLKNILGQNSGYIDKAEYNKILKTAKNQIAQYYKIMSYRSFYKKVLGQKIIDKTTAFSGTVLSSKKKKKYRKTKSGEYERETPLDKLEALNNTLLIIDEAHNVTDNEYGNAIKQIIHQSKNLKIILLSATPMINFADEIIELLNYLRPPHDPILRDRIFVNERNHMMSYKPGGIEYLKKMGMGYISHLRGQNPLTYAEGIDMGEIPDELLFTKLVRCPMERFQLETYFKVVVQVDDSLDRRSQAIANFCFPILSSVKKSIIGTYGKDGLAELKNQIKAYKGTLFDKIKTDVFNEKDETSLDDHLIWETENKNITGKILHEKYLKHFSIKFYTALKEINDVVEGKKGTGTIFVYFNLVKVGIDLFSNVLLENGYLEYNESGNYSYSANTRDALTGLPYEEFLKKYPDQTERTFYPSTFITITGKRDEKQDVLQEEKKMILDDVYSNVINKDGRYIKVLLGSRVMNEGITLENVKEMHVLDVYYNLGKLHQVIGRVLRECKHYKITSDKNKFPKVRIYKYVVSLQTPDQIKKMGINIYPGLNVKLTTEEEMYQKAEMKYILIKNVERVLKRIAVDCPINYHGNVFPEEIDKYKDCIKINDLMKMTSEERKSACICPQQCNFRECYYDCYDKTLNLKYYDRESKIYRQINKSDLDYSTFITEFARGEITIIKNKIKSFYRFRYVYTLDELLKKIEEGYINEKRDLFDKHFLYKALDELVPITTNDFNNFQDTIYDKLNNQGYLIYRKIYYIFQPYTQNEDLSMYYRTTFKRRLFNDFSIYNLARAEINSMVDDASMWMVDNKDYIQDSHYNFEDVMEYYDSKPEFEIVGIVDKVNKSSNKNITLSGSKIYFNENNIEQDVFKIRTKRDKTIQKKRAVGLPSFKGAVCETSKNKDYLMYITKKLNIKTDLYSRSINCHMIKTRLLYLEKYSTVEKNNKFTYMIIPINHKVYEFPLNLEDRIEYLQNKLKNKIPYKIGFKVKKMNNGIFENTRSLEYDRYEITFDNSEKIKDYAKFIQSLGFIEQTEGNVYLKIVE